MANLCWDNSYSRLRSKVIHFVAECIDKDIMSSAVEAAAALSSMKKEEDREKLATDEVTELQETLPKKTEASVGSFSWSGTAWSVPSIFSSGRANAPTSSSLAATSKEGMRRPCFKRPECFSTAEVLSR